MNVKENNNGSRKLRVSEVAKRLGVGRTRVHQFITEGRLPAERDPVSGWYLIDERDLDMPMGRHWREAHGVKVGDAVRLLVAPRCTGVVDKVDGEVLVVLCGRPHGMVHVSAWDTEPNYEEEVR